MKAISLDALIVLALVLVRARIDTFANAIIKRPEEVVRQIPFFGTLLGEEPFDLLVDWLADPLSQIVIAITMCLTAAYLVVDVVQHWPTRPRSAGHLAESNLQSEGDQPVKGDQLVMGDQPVAPTSVQPSAFSLQPSATHPAFRLKLGLLLTIAVVSVVGNTGMVMALRQLTTPSQFAHDGGVLMSDLAVKWLLEGKNVYQQDFRGTMVSEAYPNGPGLSHYPYLPFAFVPGVPISLLTTNWLGWYDHRLLLLIAYLVALAVVPRLATNPSDRLSLLAIVALNPLMANELIYGLNDTLVVGLIALLALALRNGQLALAGIWAGLAMATKGTVWAMLPFLALLVGLKGHRPYTRDLLRFGVPLGIAALLFVGPYLVWDAPAMFEDTVTYNGGTPIRDGLPIKGWGAATFVVALGQVDDLMAPYPFWIPELLIAAPIVVLLLIRQARLNTMPALFSHVAIALFVVALVSRTMNPNYLGFALTLLAIGYFADDPRRCERTDLPR